MIKPEKLEDQKRELVLTIFLSIAIALCISFFVVKRAFFLLPLVFAVSVPFIILIPLDYVVPVFVAVGVAIQAGLGVFFFRVAGVGTYPLEVLLFISLVALVIDILIKKKDLPLNSIFFWAFIPFLVYNIFVLCRSISLVNEGRDLSAIKVSTHNFLSYLAIFVFLAYFDDILKLRKYFYASLVGLVILSFIIFSPIIPGLISLIPIMKRGRIYMQNIGLLAFWYPVMFQYFSLTDKKSERYLIATVVAFSFIALVLSQYRAGWVGVVLSLGLTFVLNIFLLPKEKRLGFIIKVLFLGIFGLIAGFFIFRFLLPREFAVILNFLRKRVLSFKFLRYDPALLARRVGIYESRVMFKVSPIFGSGFGLSWTFLGRKVGHVDNLYWQALVQYGLFGSLLFFLPFLIWGYEILYILLNIRKIKDPLVFSFSVGLISFYIPFLLMHTTMSHLLIAPAIIVVTLSFVALTDMFYRKIKKGEPL